MSNDGKLGLLAGLAAVLVAAVVYYQKPPTPLGATGPSAVAGTPGTPPGVPPAAVVVPGGKAAPKAKTADPLTRPSDLNG